MGTGASTARPTADCAKCDRDPIMAEQKERTFIAVKPDGVQRGIIGEVIKRFETKGFKLVAMKMQHCMHMTLSVPSARPPVWEGKGVVKTGRVMLGETNPADSKPGTIRGDFCIDVSNCFVFIPLRLLCPRFTGTSSTAVTLSRVPTRRSPCGLKMTSWSTTPAVPPAGSTEHSGVLQQSVHWVET
ncbi:hypothetical protein FQN60_002625, partial [Etheostoma spectabile]